MTKESHQAIYWKFKDFTMQPENKYLFNLDLVRKFDQIQGSIVECGSWRGGMSAGIASLSSLQNRKFFLFDSFEGLPKAENIDGESAIAWQNDKDSPTYYDNCKAEKSYAEEAMKMSGASDYHIIKGWFENTLPEFDKHEKIAVLRLDGDWYKSTMDCLENLYDCVVDGGLIILDDYAIWDGCTKAVHDFLSKRKLSDSIYQYNNIVSYIVKRKG